MPDATTPGSGLAFLADLPADQRAAIAACAAPATFAAGSYLFRTDGAVDQILLGVEDVRIELGLVEGVDARGQRVVRTDREFVLDSASDAEIRRTRKLVAIHGLLDAIDNGVTVGAAGGEVDRPDIGPELAAD